MVGNRRAGRHFNGPAAIWRLMRRKAKPAPPARAEQQEAQERFDSRFVIYKFKVP
jgi:hypothetical protein